MELLSRRYRADLPQDHGDRVGGETDILGDVKIVDGLDESDAAHLKQIVQILPRPVNFCTTLSTSRRFPLIIFWRASLSPACALTMSSIFSFSFRTGSFAVFTPQISTL